MASGQSAAFANTALDAALANYRWIQLHTGAPGAAGTSNVATNNTRQQATYAAASGGAVATSADLTWASVSTTEAYTFWTAWTASTAGSFGASGAVTGGSVTAGNDFKVVAAALTVAYTLAS